MRWIKSYRFSMPSPATRFEISQVTSERSRQANSVGISFNFLVWNCSLNGDLDAH